MDIRKLDDYNKSYFEGLERSSQYSYSTQYFWWKKYEALEKIIVKIIKSKYKKGDLIKIGDIGCQIGHDIFKLSETLKDYNIIWNGIDINFDFLKIAVQRRELHKNHKFYFLRSSLENISLKKDIFDIVICSEVVEHLIDTHKSMESFYDILKSDGTAIISTPNTENVSFDLAKFICKNIFKSAGKKFREETKKEFEYREKIYTHIPEEDHTNLKSFDDWKKIFINAGFRINSVKRGSMFYGSRYLDKYPIIFSAVIFFDRLFDRCFLFNKWSYNFFFVIKKNKKS